MANLPEQWTFGAELDDIKRRLRALETAPRLHNASIGAGGLTVAGGGAIRLLDDDGNALATLDSGGLVVTDASGNVVFARTPDLWVPFRTVTPMQAAPGGDTWRVGYRIGSADGSAAGPASTFLSALWGGVRACWEEAVWIQCFLSMTAVPFDTVDVRFAVRTGSPVGPVVDSETAAGVGDVTEQFFSRRVPITYDEANGQKGTARYFTVDVSRADNRDTVYCQAVEPFALGYQDDLPAEQTSA
jgi:hypothetical protein